MTSVSYSSGDEGSRGARDRVVRGSHGAKIVRCEDCMVRGSRGVRIAWCEGLYGARGQRGARVWGAIRVKTPVFGNVYQTCDLY